MIGYYESPLGWIRYIYENKSLYAMSFMDEKPEIVIADEVINNALDGYFSGKTKSFDFDFRFDGFTPFQISVFKAMLDIPFGETKSYKDIAIAIGNPKAVRAVGQACKRNPVGIMVPCHRVIGSDHSLTGYSGKAYIHLKQKLLDLETKYSTH